MLYYEFSCNFTANMKKVFKKRGFLKEIGDVDIIGFTPEYLDAIINEVSTDNMGVNFAEPVKKEEQFTPEKKVADIQEVDEIEAGMQTARTMVCPHCGKEITI